MNFQDKLGNQSWFNYPIASIATFIVTLRQGNKRKHYRNIIGALLPEVLEQHKHQKDATNFVLRRWKSVFDDDEIKVISDLLNKGLTTAKLVLPVGLPVGIFTGVVLATTVNVAKTSMSQPSKKPDCVKTQECIVLINAATVTDIDSFDFDTGTLEVSFVDSKANDGELGIRNQGKDNGEIAINGGRVIYANQVIGTFKGGKGTNPLVVEFNKNANQETTQALLSNIVYRNTSKNPELGERKLAIQLSDGDGASSEKLIKTVNVVPDPETFTITVPSSQNIKENTNLSISGISIKYSNNQNITVTLSVSNGTLTVKDNVPKGLTAKNISENKTQEVTVTGKVEQINATLADSAAITYQGNKDFNGDEILSVNVSDSDKTSKNNQESNLIWPPNATAENTINNSIKITVIPNGLPNFTTIPNNINTKEDTNVIISGITIADSDSQNVAVILQVSNGNLKVKENVTQGLKASNIRNNGSNTVVLEGKLEQINATLKGSSAISYQGYKDYSGSDSLNIKVLDGKNSITKNVDISVEPVNDQPVINGEFIPTPPSTPINNQVLTQIEAVELVNRWLQAKREIFGPRFNRSLGAQYLTGEAYEKNIGSRSSIDWLENNNAYYTYQSQNIDSVSEFDSSDNEAIIEVVVTEARTLCRNGRASNGNNTTTDKSSVRYFLRLDQGTWKIANYKGIQQISKSSNPGKSCQIN